MLTGIGGALFGTGMPPYGSTSVSNYAASIGSDGKTGALAGGPPPPRHRGQNMVESSRTEDPNRAWPNLEVGAAVLLFAYVALAVLKQSDLKLVLPGTRFDVGALLDRFKQGIPGGTFIAPIAQVKIPLYVFYTLSPIALLALHAVLLLHPRLLAEAAAPLRWAAVWLPRSRWR